MNDARNPEPNLDDIRRFFRLLGHEPHGLTELRIIPPGKRPWIGYFDQEDAFVETCTTWNGKANVYAGRNPRPLIFAERFPQAHNNIARGIPGAKSAEIEVITALSLDIDPVRPKDTPSTDAEHERTLIAANRIAANYPNAVVIDSGNGSQILFPIAALSVNGDARRVEAQTRAWEADVRAIVEEDARLKLDSIHDLPRIIKVPGTLAIKGDSTPERPHRLARIVSKIPSEPCEMREIFERQVEVEDPAPSGGGSSPIEGEPYRRFLELLGSDSKLHATWLGQRTDLKDNTRSGHELALTSLLHHRGFDHGAIESIIDRMPGGKGNRRRNQRTLRKVENQARKGGRPPKPQAADAADDFLRDRGLQGKLYRWRGEWWIWNERCYDRLSDEECRALVVSYVREHPAYRTGATRTFAGNVMLNLESLGSLPDSIDLPYWIRPSGYERAANLVVLQNGIVDIGRFAAGHLDILQKHTPEFFCPSQLPFSFDPHAACPRWRQFLEEVLPEADSRQLLQEWFGYNLVYDTTQQHFVILEGEGANGKSVVCFVLRSLLGSPNVSAVPLEVFGVRFQLAPTLGKLANIVPEMGELDRVAEGMLKPFVTGDAMQFDRKNKEPIAAVPTARCTFATNTRPRFGDRSEGIWRRLILVPFTVTVPLERQDHTLGERLIEELPGIFNWAVQGLQRLRERGRFLEPGSSHEAKEDYKRETNPARAFLEEQCEIDPRHSIQKEALYKKYRDWAIESGYRPLGLVQFAKEVRRVCPTVQVSRPRQGEGRVQVFDGIGFPDSSVGL
jgi:P4 family phage/plasmid primase-like protien